MVLIKTITNYFINLLNSTGMNKYLMSVFAAIAFLAALTGCSGTTDLYDSEAADEMQRIQKELAINEKYTVAFEKAFGKVGPNVDWGFSSKNTSTRAYTRAGDNYADYRGNFQPTIEFPTDCDPGKFNPDLTDVPSYAEYLSTLGTQWWHPEYINTSGEVYIDKVQPVRITGGETRSKLYITKPGTYDFTNEQFDLCKNADLYLLSGVTLILSDDVASTATFDIYIASGAELKANGEKGFVANSGARIYNHGKITCSSFEVNSTSFLYNVGTLEAGSVNAESNPSRIVNDGIINCTTVVVNAGAVQNNYQWNVAGTTEVNSNNSGWVNNGHWTTSDYAYVGGSWNVINNCLLDVENDFAMNISSEKGAFKIGGGGGVLTQYFDGGKSSTGAVSGPFVIVMGPEAVFVVEETAILESGRGDEDGFGIFGPSTGEYAVFQAKNIARDPYLESIKSHGAVTYGGHLYVSAVTHFPQGKDSDGSGTYVPQPFIIEADNFSIANNIFAGGFKTGKPSINIPETPCSPGFLGGDPLYRVIAEDLSASEAGDFDFNDIVFDVVKAENNKTTLRLICAGGVLPLRVMGIEIHGLFGEKNANEKGVYQMYNTGAGPNVDPVEFTIDGTFTDPETIKDIIIEVFKEGEWMELKANTGEAACKILVDDTFVPVTEKRNIADENNKFTDYVTGEFVDDFWWK